MRISGATPRGAAAEARRRIRMPPLPESQCNPMWASQWARRRRHRRGSSSHRRPGRCGWYPQRRHSKINGAQRSSGRATTRLRTGGAVLRTPTGGRSMSVTPATAMTTSTTLATAMVMMRSRRCSQRIHSEHRSASEANLWDFALAVFRKRRKATSTAKFRSTPLQAIATAQAMVFVISRRALRATFVPPCPAVWMTATRSSKNRTFCMTSPDRCLRISSTLSAKMVRIGQCS
mmetsp:Transcript_16470/g.47741  ORF Transcript_16470/g.47741 Transcript_16470/m.47741 type:complete len:233 (+) Transcript_16470:960-1658(+)